MSVTEAQLDAIKVKLKPEPEPPGTAYADVDFVISITEPKPKSPPTLNVRASSFHPRDIKNVALLPKDRKTWIGRVEAPKGSDIEFEVFCLVEEDAVMKVILQQDRKDRYSVKDTEDNNRCQILFTKYRVG